MRATSVSPLCWTEATFVDTIIIIGGMIVFPYRPDFGLLK